jgi:DNA-binding HxlR family transcriptional regulator
LRQLDDKRRYEDACGLAHAMELLGERWAMLVLRELAYGPRRFSELKADLKGISANVLAQRLGELEKRKLVRKTKLAPPASVQVYEATEWGLEVVPLIASLGRWAARSPWHDPTLQMSHVSVVMSLQTLISPALAEGLDVWVGFDFDGVTYVTTIRDGRLEVKRAPIEDCDLVFSGSPSDIAAVIHGGAPLDLIAVKGDMDLANRFLTLFPLPPKIG